MINYIDNKRKIVGVTFALFTIFVWGITFVCTKYLLRTFSSFEILVGRFCIAYLGLWVLYPHSMHVQHKKDELLFLCAGLSGVTVYQFLENLAISYTTASNVSIIVAISPIFTATTAQVFLHEKHITPKFIAGFCLAIIGIALVSWNGSIVLHASPKGDILAFGSAVSWGFYSLFVSKINYKGYKTLPATRRIFFYAVLCMALLAVLDNIPVVHAMGICHLQLSPAHVAQMVQDPWNLINLCFLGMVASSFCFAAWGFACRTLGTVKVTVGIYAIPVVTVIFAFFVLHEPITLMGMIGTALTIGGLYISER